MKKSLALLFLTSMIIGCANNGSVSDSTSNNSSDPIDEKHYQMLFDNKFEKGFLFSPANCNGREGIQAPDNRWMNDVKLTFGDNDGSGISWLGQQHGDIYSLNDVYNRTTNNVPAYKDGYYTFSDESKKLSVNPTTGSLYMELNTSKEYMVPRKDNEDWCHLLLSQGFQKSISVKECESIDFTIDLDMKKFEDYMDGKANTNVHAAQFLMYLVIKSEAGLDANDFFWFGIPFFDNRYPNGVPEGGNVDAGGAGATSKYIYHMDSNEFIPGGLHLGQKRSVNIDLKPQFAYALAYTQSKGYFTNSTVDDLTFQSMNIGFEIPGTYDCGIEISNFSLTANYK